MALIQCTNCGHPISDKAVKCPKCGHSLQKNKSAFEPKKSQTSSQKNRKLFILGSIFLLMAVIAFIVFNLLRSEQDATLLTTEKQSLVIKAVQYEKEDGDFSIRIAIDYPVAGNTVLINNIRDYINEIMSRGNTIIYGGDATDGQALVDFYGTKKYEQWNADKNPEGWNPYFEEFDIKKVYEDDTYISYRFTYTGNWGGASSEGIEGKTFDKINGTALTLDDPNKTELKQLLLSEMREQIGESFEYVNESYFYDMSVPTPYIIEEGLQFDYPKYTLGPGSLGSISVIIPFNKVQPFLK